MSNRNGFGFAKISMFFCITFCPLDAMSFVSADAANVMIDTVKFSEDGRDIIVRLNEFENRRSEVTLTTFADVCEAFDCDLMENNETALPVKNGKITLPVKPYEIKTIRLRTK